MKKKMNKKLINMLKAFKNSLGDDAKELADAISAAIAEAEASEEVVTADELSKKLEGVIASMKKEAEKAAEEAVEEAVEEIQNKFDKFKIEMKNAFNHGGGSNYLDSPQAVKDFMNCIRKASSGGEHTKLWKEVLIKNDITGLAYPTELFAEIQTKWEGNTGLVNAIRKISNKAIKIPYTTQDKSDLDVRAKGHKKGKVKLPQNLVLNDKQINLQFVYKDLPIDRIDLVSIEDDAALIRWVVEELAFMLAYEIERAILIGDGRTSGDDRITTIEAIGSKTVTDAWTVVTPRTKDTLIEDIKALLDTMVDKGRGIWLFMSKQNITALQEFKAATGATTQYQSLDVIKNALGVEEIKAFDLGEGIEVVAMVPDLYFRSGGEPFGEKWTIYEKNQEAFRSEVAIGGAIGGLLSTGVLTAAAGSGE